MRELVIESTPNGAEIKISGKAIGTTPISINIDDTTTIGDFRNECMSAGSVVCDWGTLRGWMESKQVSKMWWDLTRNERHSITLNAIRNNNYTSSSLKVLTGDSDCEGGVYKTYSSSCSSAAAIRYTKFAVPVSIVNHNGPSPTGNIDGCYFRLGYDQPIRCLRQPNPYYLPCFFVQCLNDAENRRHILCAVQIENSFDSLDNFVVFQYGDVDIKVGDSQMMPNCKVVLYSPLVIGCFGTDSRIDGAIVVASFDV